MINTSAEYKNYIVEDRRFKMKANITLFDSTFLPITNDEILQNGMSFDDAVSGPTSLDVGTAIIGKHTLSFHNEGLYDDYDFSDATVVPFVGLELSSTTEYLQKGVYTVDEPKFIGDVVILECLDNMHKFEKPFSEVEIAFPTTNAHLLLKICLECGVVLATPTLPNGSYIITERPNDEALSCLDVVSYIAQINGCFARCNTTGSLEIKWFDLSVFENENHVNGGIFDESTPYSTGDNVDGGNLTNYNTGDIADGGSYLNTNKYHHIYNLGSTPTIAIDDVVVTGVSVEITDADGEIFTYLSGSPGYLLKIANNPLIQSKEQAESVADYLGSRLIGMKCRPFSAYSLSDPCYEVGDPVYLSARNSRGITAYQSYITELKYTVGQRMTIKNVAESPNRNSSTRYSAETKTQVEARKTIKRELTAYDLMMQRLNNLIANSFGVYRSEVTLEDGSKIYYMHDKPTLEESQKIWRQDAETFAASSDGGQTWHGMDADGNLIVNVLSAIGINCDWLTAGKIWSTSGDVLVDLDLGVANSDNFSVSDNVANGFPLRIPFNIDESVSMIKKVLLKYTQDKFRTYSTNARSGGGSSQTSSTDESLIVVSQLNGNFVTNSTEIYGGSGTGVALSDGSYAGTTSGGNGADMHIHAYSIPNHMHVVETPSHSHGYHSHYFQVNHSHGVTVEGHSHMVDIPSHTHDLNFGIQETPITDYTIEVYVDDILRHTIANNSANTQGIIDLTDYITTNGWHTIELRSSSLKKISAQVNLKSYIKN